MTLATRDLCVAYGADRSRRALDAVSIAVEAGHTLAIVGPSGAGKTTLLRAIAGLLAPSSGDVLLDGSSVVALAPQARRIALVFQDDALFANMSVRRNLEFALRPGAREDRERVRQTAAALHVSADHLGRRPRELSGGERQRASIARALLSDPHALLLDEPLAHLDPSLRRSVRDELLGVAQSFAGPIVYVTHDHAEAMSVGDELAVLIGGRIEDAGEPQRVYESPRSLTVARFLGDRPMNVFDDGDALAGIRPEHARLDASAALRGRVVATESTGADAYVTIATQRGELTVRVPAADAPKSGEDTGVDLPQQFVRRFDAQTGLART